MTKTEADMLKKIEVWWLLRGMEAGELKRAGLSWGKDGSNGSIGYEIDLDDTDKPPQVRFHYSQTQMWSEEEVFMDYVIPLVKTPCHFGGFRYWFSCQGTGTIPCNKRVGVLYKDGFRFACRHCHDLTYSSRNINQDNTSVVMCGYLLIGEKMEKLAKSIKRKTWRGEPTRKYRKLQFMEAKQFAGEYKCAKILKSVQQKQNWSYP